MKAKTIKAILTKKHKEFCASIEDEHVRDLVERNSIVTGGAIVSMLLGERISDFDYYFTDKETVLAVAGYYVDRLNKRKGSAITVHEDGDRVRVNVRNTGAEFQDVEGDEDEISLDADIGELAEDLEQEKYRVVFVTDNAITLTNKVQLIIRFYGNAEEIHENYDYEHCKCYWESGTGKLVLPQKALECILTKELRYSGSKYPLCSIFRVRKYVERGWTINAGQILKMALQLNDMDLHDPDELREQLVGVDIAYFMHVIDTIREKQEKDPDFKIGTAYLMTIIDRIF